VLGIVGNLDPLDEAFPKHLTRFAKQPKFRGLRIGHDSLRKAWKARTIAGSATAGGRNLELDVNAVPNARRRCATGRELLKLRICINHCANVRIDGKPRRRTGSRACKRRRSCERFCKVSPWWRNRADQGKARPIRRTIARLDVLWNAFGADRLLYAATGR